MNQVVVIEGYLWKKKILFCIHCNTNTVHALAKSHEYYSCGCGNIIDIEYEESINE